MSPLPSLEPHLKKKKCLAATWKGHCLHTTGSHHRTSFHSNKKLHSLFRVPFKLSELNLIIRIQIPSTLINKYQVNGGATCYPRTSQRIQGGSWLLRQTESESWIQVSNSPSIENALREIQDHQSISTSMGASPYMLKGIHTPHALLRWRIVGTQCQNWHQKTFQHCF